MIKNSLKNRGFSKPTDQYAQNSGTRKKAVSGRFSKQLLHDIRNLIPIRRLIEIELVIPNHTESGIFRFECPLCKGYHSSVKQDTNLARCFDCRRNFNTIENVMDFRKMDFRPAVEFLIPILKESSSEQAIHKTEIICKTRAEKLRSSGDPVDLGSVIQSMPELKQFNASLENRLIEQRIQKLEKEIEEMKVRMDQFYDFLVREFKREFKRNV